MRFRLKSGAAVGYQVRGAGPVVLLLHPIGLSASFWKPVAQRLADRYRVIAVDARGHGDSDVPAGPFSLEDLADDAIELLRALAGPAIVVGCSMGASVAQMIAVRAPELVSCAVFANCSGPRVGGRTDVLDERARRAAEGMPRVLEETLARWFSAGFPKAHPEVVAQVTDWLLSGDPTVHSWGWKALSARRNDHYKSITQPVLVLAGEHDAASPPASARQLAEALPNATYVEVPAGHMAPLERPDAFAAAIDDFAARVGSKR
jgi:pimeloyl-ACP methyl ester carboxylesterase